MATSFLPALTALLYSLTEMTIYTHGKNPCHLNSRHYFDPLTNYLAASCMHTHAPLLPCMNPQRPATHIGLVRLLLNWLTTHTSWLELFPSFCWPLAELAHATTNVSDSCSISTCTHWYPSNLSRFHPLFVSSLLLVTSCQKIAVLLTSFQSGNLFSHH